ncbi:GreA/GreB family elongation factor [Patescibacteria group bacterium]|nr:GreA/GreB family elongation factor [Patescibacteria group bacterium]MBU4274736.1 GreA/GreB family elongation factor [Patescibacteria group bacterium]MBU4367820.1 GreA/GreB family elongation factor [Patescibacteria group bacterium]MBU4461530.1 GreA/GreB family elongation factor [Patescibacteria group bacterium]MCG2700329.1 hypothetical protein [Candidatus Parcubacteria bacterium]
MLEKRKVLEACIKICEEKIENLKQSLESTQRSAVDAVSSRVSWSDTSKFQLSNLALGIERRIIEARLALSYLQYVGLIFTDTICMGALFGLRDVNSGKINHYLLIFEGGGDSFKIDDEEIMAISETAPLAQAVMGKRKGDRVTNRRGRTFEIIEVQ